MRLAVMVVTQNWRLLQCSQLLHHPRILNSHLLILHLTSLLLVKVRMQWLPMEKVQELHQGRVKLMSPVVQVTPMCTVFHRGGEMVELLLPMTWSG
jgi:hypothetical protein